MTTLVFFLIVLILIVLFIRLLIKLIRRKPTLFTIRSIAIVILAYGLTWVTFALTKKMIIVPMGSDVCFDDWCSTVTKAERQPTADSIVVILHIRMSNHARGIGQKPSEPRVHILDADGHAWGYSAKWQKNYEEHHASQPGIGTRLQLHQSMETVLVFALPKGSTGLKAFIEEGPWITNLLFPEDYQVFLL